MGERRDPNGDSRGEHARERELLGPYVLGALDPEEERAVERHLGGCAACRNEERELRETHERFAGASIASSSVPPELKARILGALPRHGGAPSSGTARVGRVALAVAAVLLLFAFAAVAYSAGLFGRAAETAMLEPTELAPGAGGELKVQSSGPNAEASLEVWDLPTTEPNEYYELWFGREGGRVSAGTFTVDDSGRGRLSASAPTLDGDYQRVGITLEEFPEEPRMDSARVVLRGNLRGA